MNYIQIQQEKLSGYGDVRLNEILFYYSQLVAFGKRFITLRRPY